MPKRMDLVGLTFGRLRVVSYEATDKHGKAMWRCVCECGVAKTIRGQNLTQGLTVSCGCYHREQTQRVGKIEIHGYYKSPTHRVWRGAIKRCTDRNNRKYANYGGRGITVCARWTEPHGLGFLNFLADMGERPEGMTLDRIDVDGPYSPANCRWATQLVQQNNRRNNRRVAYLGITLTVAQWARALGLKDAALRDRITRRGWPIERALTEDVDPDVLAAAVAEHSGAATAPQPDHSPDEGGART